MLIVLLMKTTTTLRAALPLTLAGLLFACGSPSSSPSDPSEGDPSGAGEEGKTTPPIATPAPTPPAAAPPAPAPAPVPAPVLIPTAKIHAAPVFTYAVAEDAVWVATDIAVERMKPDGTLPAPVPALANAMALATDGARIFAFIDKGLTYELFSMKSDGTEGAHHLNWSWSTGDPSALTLHDGRAYFRSTNPERPSQSLIASVPAAPPVGGGNVAWRLEEYVDAQTLSLAFAPDRVFSVDFYRQSAATRVSLIDTSKSVDVVHAEVPYSAGGIAADATDVFTRTTKGIVKVAIGSGQGTEPVIAVPSATCSIFDPADGSESALDDALVVDETTIYTACRAGANVEVRAYPKNGTAPKVIATAPYTGGISHLKVTTTAVYWLSKASVDSMDDELWRASK